MTLVDQLIKVANEIEENNRDKDLDYLKKESKANIGLNLIIDDELI